jgi:hypothetical protein
MCKSAPIFCHLDDQVSQALLVSLRNAVEPILTNNILPHFTDHSVHHSDRLVELIGNLVKPLAGNNNALTYKELIVLYSGCYLHDIGMQYDRAGDTTTIRRLNLPQPWDDLQDTTRRELLRQHHHEISAELIHNSIRAEHPPIGLQLTDQYEPGYIACLCEAHAIDVGSNRYRELIKVGPDIRMELLSAILRLADILDECRRRAPLEKERTLNLGPIAKMHWWRNYYTKAVTFDEPRGIVNLWFEFPAGCDDEYSKILPRLQIPLIEDEFSRHQLVFAHYRLNWVVREKYDSIQYSQAEAMPDQVMAEMLKELRSRQLVEDEKQRQASLTSFKEARPLIQRQLKELKNSKDQLSLGEYLKRMSEIANLMWDTGSKRSACIMLDAEFDRSAANLDWRDRIEIGTRLLAMLRELGWPDLGRNAADIIRQEAENEQTPNRQRYRCFAEVARWCNQMAGDNETLDYFDRALQVAGDDADATRLRAERDEILLLMGKLDCLCEEKGGVANND